MNYPITLAWLKMYNFSYLEQTTHEAVRLQPTTTAKKQKKLPRWQGVFSVFTLYMVYVFS